jgi:hypothetical protein
MDRSQIERAAGEVAGLSSADKSYIAGLVIGATLFSNQSMADVISKVVKKIENDSKDDIDSGRAEPLKVALEKLG